MYGYVMHSFTMFTTSVNLEIQNYKLPEIPLDMRCCDGSDNEDFEVKPEPMDRDDMKSEECPPGLESENPHNNSLPNAQLHGAIDSGTSNV